MRVILYRTNHIIPQERRFVKRVSPPLNDRSVRHGDQMPLSLSIYLFRDDFLLSRKSYACSPCQSARLFMVNKCYDHSTIDITCLFALY